MTCISAFFTFYRSIDERYQEVCKVAKSRSVISLGLSCFQLVSSTDSDDAEQYRCSPYSVQTFNIVLLCSEEYVVEPASLKFLCDHGFDFNEQYMKGISYYRGKDLERVNTTHAFRSLSLLYLPGTVNIFRLTRRNPCRRASCSKLSSAASDRSFCTTRSSTSCSCTRTSTPSLPPVSKSSLLTCLR